MISQFVIEGKDGKILSIEEVFTSSGIATVIKKDVLVRPEDHKYIQLQTFSHIFQGEKEERKMLFESFEKFYKNWNFFGPYGDVANVTFNNDGSEGCNYIVTSIGHIHFPHPTLTADLVLFIRDAAHNVFFVGIIRKNLPGINMPAFIGGHRDLDGMNFETAPNALLHESNEEASFVIIPAAKEEASGKYKTMPYKKSVRVEVHLEGKTIETDLYYIDSFLTKLSEKLPKINRKRVDETAAYSIYFRLPKILTEAKIKKMFAARSDAQDIFVCNTRKASPNFGIDHHKDIYVKTKSIYENEGLI